MSTPFLAEVAESPAALSQLIEAWSGPERSAVQQWLDPLAATRRIVAVGMGTSSFALETMAPGLARAKIGFHFDDAGEFLHGSRPTVDGEQLFLCSQSGRSIEIVKLIERGIAGGFAALTNDSGSPLARAGRPTFLLHAGAEASISTKTYVNTLAAGHLLGAAVSRTWPAWTERLHRVARSLSDSVEAVAGAEKLSGCHALAVVGRTCAAPAARQLALTLTEGAGMWGVPYVGGSFRHGPLEACGPTNGVVAFAQRDSAGSFVVGACERAAQLGSPVVLLTDRDDLPEGVEVIRVPSGDDPEDFSLRASTAQARLLAALAGFRGREAGVFRVISKVTSLE